MGSHCLDLLGIPNLGQACAQAGGSDWRLRVVSSARDVHCSTGTVTEPTEF